MSGVWIAPAYADPPAPVSSVTVEPDGPQYVKVSWTGQDPNATGVRVCAKLGGYASVNPADCDDAQDRVAQTSTYLQLKPAKTYSFSVFDYTGNGTARQYSQAVTTPAWHGTTTQMNLDTRCTYRQPCTFSALVKDTHRHAALVDQTAQLWMRPPRNTAEWQLRGTAKTNSSGHASLTVTFNEPKAQEVQWRFPGSDQLLGSGSIIARIVPQFSVTVHLTKSTAQPGERVKIWGAVRPQLSNVTAFVLTYDTHEHAFAAGNGPSVQVRQRRLPNGHTAFGYVMTVSRSGPGTSRLMVGVEKPGYAGDDYSREVDLTVE